MPDCIGRTLPDALRCLRALGAPEPEVAVGAGEGNDGRGRDPGDPLEIVSQDPPPGCPVEDRIRLGVPGRSLLRRLPSIFETTDAAGGHFLRGLLHVPAHILCETESRMRELPALLDPSIAPAAALPWLSRLVGLPPGSGLPPGRLRATVARAPEIWRWRGTARGLRLGLEALLGWDGVRIDERSPSRLPRIGEARVVRSPGERAIVLIHAPRRRSALTGPERAGLRRAIRLLAPAHARCEVRLRDDPVAPPPGHLVGDARVGAGPGRVRRRPATGGADEGGGEC